MQKIEWITRSNKKATVTIRAEVIEETYRDDYGNTHNTNQYHLDWDIVAEVEGLGVVGTSYLTEIQEYGENDRGIAASIGKLGLTIAQLKKYKDAVSAEKANKLNNNKEYSSYLEKIEKGKKVREEYEENVRKIENMMTLNGRTN